MAEIASAYVSLIPSARGFGRATSAQINPQMRTTGATAGAALGKSMLKAFVAIGIATKVTQFLGDSISEAREAQKVAALTANVIKTTGGAANVTAKQVDRLSNAFSKKTGIDDEQIASSENLLLTFKNIVRVGDGMRNVFARATKASVDLSASGFGAMDSTAKLVGKALNDPVKGLTALSRAGVTFSQQQQDQIKGLVESNKLFQAQNLILKEVESQVKGSAEAQATNADKARVALGNLKEQIGTALLPAIDAVSGAFANKIAPAISKFITQIQTGQGQAGHFAALLKAQLPPILDGLKSAFNQVKKAIADNKPELIQIGNAVKKLIPVLGRLANGQLKILGAELRVVITVIAACVRQFNALKATGTAVGKAIAGTVRFFEQFVQGVRKKMSNAVSFVRGIPDKITSALGDLSSLLTGAGHAVIQGLIDGIGDMIKPLKDKLHAVTSLIPKHKGPPAKDKALLYGSGGLIMDGLIAGIAAKEKPLADKLDKVTDKVKTKLKDKLSQIRDALSTATSDFASLVEPVASNFTQGLFDFTNASAFTSNLATVKHNLSGLIANFTKLKKEGLAPSFLYQLFQSGGPELIASLAALDTKSANAAGGLFGDVMGLSNQLGTAVAGSTDKGAALENQTQRLEKKLDHVIKAIHQGAKETADGVNGAAANGRRRAA